MDDGKMIRHFTDLVAWQKAHEFTKLVYQVSRHFPSEEQFGLTSQLRRSASSVGANIAEGFGRFHFKDKIRFFYQARGSNTESQNHIILAHDLGFLSEEEYASLKIAVYVSYKILCGLIASTSEQV